MVRPTKFDKKFSLVREATARTETGGIKAASESVLFTDWCNKKPVSGTKRMDYTNLKYSDPYTLTMRKRTDTEILSTDIIRFGTKNYQIKSMYESEDERFIIMDVAR